MHSIHIHIWQPICQMEKLFKNIRKIYVFSLTKHAYTKISRLNAHAMPACICIVVCVGGGEREHIGHSQNIININVYLLYIFCPICTGKEINR